jgi:hypothetical protein
MSAGPALVSLCKGNLWFSLAELLVVLPRGWGTSLFLVPRGNGFWGCAAWSGGPPLVSGCCGVSWAADRPASVRFRSGPAVVGALPGGSSRRPARTVFRRRRCWFPCRCR